MGAKINQQEKIFKKWVLGRRTLEELSKEYKKSISTLQRIFKNFLDNPPIFKIIPNNKCHLLIDGTYFKRKFCLIEYFDHKLNRCQFAKIVHKENLGDFFNDLNYLEKAGLNIISITSDGHKGLVAAIKIALPKVIHQRCIIHIQRMSLAYLTRNPKTHAGRDLRFLVKLLHKIDTQEKKNIWIKELEKWNVKYEVFLKEKSESISGRKWYTHKLLRRTRSLIKNALPNMFHYLNNPNIPKSTNGLESRFSYLKNNVNVHRGLSDNHRKSFILWYVFYKNNS